jgi:hypothetical protein
VTSPLSEAAIDSDGSAEAAGEPVAPLLGDGVAAPPHAATTMERPARAPSTRILAFMSCCTPP